MVSLVIETAPVAGLVDEPTEIVPALPAVCVPVLDAKATPVFTVCETVTPVPPRTVMLLGALFVSDTVSVDVTETVPAAGAVDVPTVIAPNSAGALVASFAVAVTVVSFPPVTEIAPVLWVESITVTLVVAATASVIGPLPVAFKAVRPA